MLPTIIWLNYVALSTLFPRLSDRHSAVLAVGILGATIMPHVIFLHSSLTQGRIITRDPQQLRRLFGYEVLDIILAMGLAGVINAAMLLMAAKAFYERGLFDVDAIEKAYLTLEPILGKAAGFLFAFSLLASGLSSSAVGTMSGQVIMQGFLNRHIPVWLRRIATMAPALIVIMLGLDPTQTLILSQVLLSFGLPMAIIPLVLFTRNKELMGVLVNRKSTTAAAWLVAALVIGLNFFLLYQLLWEK